jgi:hypothetical protein
LKGRRRREEEQKYNGGHELAQGTLYACLELSLGIINGCQLKHKIKHI